jgi:hypothetical protein
MEFSPYCQKCDSCGHDGCCSWLSCFKSSISDDKCDYGESYYKDALFARNVANLSEEMMSKVDSGEINTLDDLKKYYNEEWDKEYNKVYNQIKNNGK